MLSRLMRRERLETSIEGTCREHAEARGYKFLKVTSVVGAPDRLLVLPSGRVAWIELKRPREGLERIQAHRAGELIAMGHRAYRVDSVGAFDNLLDDLEVEWKLRKPQRLENYSYRDM